MTSVRRPAHLCAALTLLVSGAVFAGDAPGEMPAAMSCKFETGHSWSYEAGKFTSAPPKSLALDIKDIDLEKQAATLVMENATGTLRIVRALNANHFLEVANEGFLNLTTIYDQDSTSGAYPAVHSRHFGLMGQPFFAQYAGTCTAK